MAKATTGETGGTKGDADTAPEKVARKPAAKKAAASKSASKPAASKSAASRSSTAKKTATASRNRSVRKEADHGKAAPEFTDDVTDDTAPGEGPVTISATEARASEPVMADESALASDTPPPASNPKAATSARRTGDASERPVSGDGDYVGDPSAPTAEHGEAEFNAAAARPGPGEMTADGVRYEDVRHASTPEERLEKREIELGAEMDYVEHRKTYTMFMNATKYGTAIVIALLVAMAIGFFIAGSFFGGLFVFVGAALAAIWFLR